MMERLGLDEDSYIESGMVGKTVESAQGRVEGYNFDMRKRVVEFDDVINRQRETIYAERDKVLHNEDLTETVRRFLDDEIDALVDQHLSGEDHEAWNLDALSAALAAMGLGGEETSADTIWDKGGREAIAEYLREVADARLDAREAEVGETDWAQVERIVLVRTIDSLWVEHLTELDDMRRGIGLRGYAQQDPLNEFRREAFRMYEEFRELIRHGVASSIFRVTVQRQPAGGADAAVAQDLTRGVAALRGSSGNGAGAAAGGAGAGTAQPVGARAAGSAVLRGALPSAPAARNVTASLGGEPITDGASGSGAVVSGGGGVVDPAGPKPGYTPSGARIGRNDPCWCGSGAKYKKCHGR
jgi:preprotein translocase subunit SecA